MAVNSTIHTIPVNSVWRYDESSTTLMDMIVNGSYVGIIREEIDMVYFCNPRVLHYEQHVIPSGKGDHYFTYAICDIVR